jgi:hypothetical protein
MRRNGADLDSLLLYLSISKPHRIADMIYSLEEAAVYVGGVI